MLRRQNLAGKMFSIQRSRFTDEQIALILQQGIKKIQVMNNPPEIAYFSYVQSQVPKVPRYPVRIQTSLPGRGSPLRLDRK